MSRVLVPQAGPGLADGVAGPSGAGGTRFQVLGSLAEVMDEALQVRVGGAVQRQLVSPGRGDDRCALSRIRAEDHVASRAVVVSLHQRSEAVDLGRR
jgi:hypothetical protein